MDFYPGPSQAPPGQAPSAYGNAPPAYGYGAPYNTGMAGIGLGVEMGSRFLGSGREMVQANLSKFGITHAGLRSYFAVDNLYVLNKLKILLLPYVHKSWTRQRKDVRGENESVYMPPRNDLNAPDLYIPLMAFVTYILAVGYTLGLGQRFKPEVLGMTASSGLGVLLFEVLLLKLGFYLLNSPPLPFFDAISYAGYKYVGVNITIISGIIAPVLYYPALLVTSLGMAVFTMKSLGMLIRPVAVSAMDGDAIKRNYFLLAIAVAQVPFSYFLAVTA
eukprot:tig00020903_g15086.t1